MKRLRLLVLLAALPLLAAVAWSTTGSVAFPGERALAATSSCHPLTNNGKCYEPGEFCRNSDHGATGVAGDGKTIVCEFNNGWRWEPVAGSTSTPASGGQQTQVRPPVTGDGSMAGQEDSR